MSLARYLIGDVFARLAEIEDGSVDLTITSPPFLALRSYLSADHPDKDKEIGSEPTPAAFIDVMLLVMAELRRVTAPHGSVCVELGDTYAGSGGAGGDYLAGGWREGQARFDGSGRLANYSDNRGNPDGMRDPTFSGANTRTGGGGGWPLAKSRTLIPELFRIALAYGINPLTGTESPAGKWLVRNVVTWCRPNPPVGALGDKWRPATSDVVVACTSPKRYWDDLATRRPALSGETGAVVGVRSPSRQAWRGDSGGELVERLETVSHPSGAPLLDYWEIPLDGGEAKPYGPQQSEPYARSRNAQRATPPGQRPRHVDDSTHPAGSPLLDYWVIPPTGYSGAHYAVYPPALVEPLVKAMGPQRVCRTCGEPSRRIVETEYEPTDNRVANRENPDGGRPRKSFGMGNASDSVQRVAGANRLRSTLNTTGWTDCGHGSIVCSSCAALVPYDYAIQRSRHSSQVQSGVGEEEVLGESGEGAGEPEEASGSVRGLRNGVPGKDEIAEDVQPVVLGEVRSSRGPDELVRVGTGQPELEGWPQGEPSGIRPDLGSAGLSGTTQERLHDGAPSSDAGTSRSATRSVGVGSPQERDQGRQPDREPSGSDPYEASGSGDLSELPNGVPDSLTGHVCSCGSESFKYVADHWRPGLILDPFAGSGTTLQVATGHGLDAVGIDLDRRNVTLARERIGPLFFEVVDDGELHEGAGT